jgi:uncharacterized SAM-binding protein YcdF (DUF218 family)
MKKSLTALLILVFLLGMCAFSLRPLGDSLVVQDPLEKADLITASSGPEYRIIYAAELYKKGLGAVLFYTGGYSEENQRSEANWSKYLAKITGVPEEAITIDETSVISTYDEAAILQKYIETHPDTIHSIILVTDAYHTRRAKWIYQRVLGEGIHIIMAPVPFDRTELSKTWWSDAKSRRFVFNEHLKYLYYILRYQLATGSFQKWLSQFDRF